MWISKRLFGLVAALEGLVEAVSKDDQVEVVRHMGYVTDIRKDIESHWGEMFGTLERAEHVIRNLGNAHLGGEVKDNTLHEAASIRYVLSKQEETDEVA